MAIGERIHFFRLLRGMTQKYLGTAVGFPKGAPMYAWRNMKPAPANQRRI